MRYDAYKTMMVGPAMNHTSCAGSTDIRTSDKSPVILVKARANVTSETGERGRNYGRKPSLQRHPVLQLRRGLRFVHL